MLYNHSFIMREILRHVKCLNVDGGFAGRCERNFKVSNIVTTAVADVWNWR